MTSAVARAYNSGLGAEPPAGSRGRAPGQGVFQWKPQICPLLYNLETQRNQIFVLSLQKIMGGHETGGAGAKLGGVPSGPGLKPPLRLAKIINLLAIFYSNISN